MNALKNSYAIGAFNFSSLEMLKMIISASEECDAPVIAQFLKGALKYIEKDYLKAIIKEAKKDQNKQSHVSFGPWQKF